MQSPRWDSSTHIIFSSHKIREAAATTILSKRWNDMWMAMPTLDFYGDCDKRDSLMDLVERALCGWSSKLQEFKLCLCVNSDESCLNYWISAAVRRKIQALDMSLYYDKPFLLPDCLFTCDSLTTLRLDLFSLHSLKLLPVVRFSSLICLTKVQYSEVDLPSVTYSAQLALVYPSTSRWSCFVNNKHYPRIDYRYLKILYMAIMCVSEGACINWLTKLTA